MSSDREQFAAAAEQFLEELYVGWGITPGLPTPVVAAHRFAEFLADRGWRPPTRVIETVGDLERLGHQAVIRASDETVYERHYGSWFVGGEGARYDSSEIGLPATVLWSPDEAKEEQ